MERTRWNDDLETWCDERYYRKDEIDRMIGDLELNSGLVFSVEVEDEIFCIDDGVQEFRANLSWSNGTGVEGKGVLFNLVDSNNNVIDTSLVNTDINGYAVYEYTPTGLGELFVTASYGMFLQETFVVYDCITIDNGTIEDHNDSIWNSLVGVTRDDEYTIFNSTGAVVRYVSITDDVAIELDVRTTMASNAQIFRINQNGTTLYAPTVANCEMTANTWKHIILRIKDNMLSIDDTSISDVDVTGFNQLGLRSAGNEYTYFKNLRIYSI